MPYLKQLKNLLLVVNVVVMADCTQVPLNDSVFLLFQNLSELRPTNLVEIKTQLTLSPGSELILEVSNVHQMPVLLDVNVRSSLQEQRNLRPLTAILALTNVQHPFLLPRPAISLRHWIQMAAPPQTALLSTPAFQMPSNFSPAVPFL
jgi:hypothetical protein